MPSGGPADSSIFAQELLDPIRVDVGEPHHAHMHERNLLSVVPLTCNASALDGARD